MPPSVNEINVFESHLYVREYRWTLLGSDTDYLDAVAAVLRAARLSPQQLPGDWAR